ncbi:MAG: type I methionyl aminopeptidase [candidate division Zixibacteria bacterium]|nr:type I methionyl aminopeptidase [candidate division Zixibacteria bacterium]
MIELKTQEELEIMREAGRITAMTLDMVEENIEAGLTTGQLDMLVEDFIRSHGAIPAFKNYQGYPASACISIDSEVVHGIPGKRVIKEGQIVSVDIGAIVNNYYGDSARTFAIGEVSEDKQRLMEVTQEALSAAIDKARKGNRLGQVSSTVQRIAEEAGFGVVRQLVGHGIGRKMHEEPQVPNFGSPNDGPVLQVGMVLAIEPMINLGTYDVKTMPDGWTIVTADGAPSAHFEHTVAITDNGPRILTTA